MISLLLYEHPKIADKLSIATDNALANKSSEIHMGKKADYGLGPKVFLDYQKMIVQHPSFAGMPDLYKDDGTIQWEAPSNRLTGKFKDTNQKRRDWWAQKARSLGINPESGKWLSRTAKAIHPTGIKPCKNCGQVLSINYVYPNYRFLLRIKSLPYFEESFPLDPLEHVLKLLERLVEHFGNKVLMDIPAILRYGPMLIPEFNTIDECLKWVKTNYIPAEPSTLSPGAMSNAPDRLDGFHSFNLCCRSKADTGRTKQNLQSYVTDRRVFEYWVEGDWVAANTLMGLIRSDVTLRAERCANGHDGPCAADHVGPISLGFLHRPSFRLLCNACNGARNNRMDLSDVKELIATEGRGENIVSWYAKPLWDFRKMDVSTDEMALRLSKLLRDNRHSYMAMLQLLAKKGHFAFLATLLDLDMADYDVTFKNVRAIKSIVVYDKMQKTPRTTKYALEQKARRVRVGFESLNDYFLKGNRNAYVISNPKIEGFLEKVLSILAVKPKAEGNFDNVLSQLQTPECEITEMQIATIVEFVKEADAKSSRCRDAKEALKNAMQEVASELSSCWNNERYVRALAEDLS